jgi:hypothetical protein
MIFYPACTYTVKRWIDAVAWLVSYFRPRLYRVVTLVALLWHHGLGEAFSPQKLPAPHLGATPLTFISACDTGSNPQVPHSLRKFEL